METVEINITNAGWTQISDGGHTVFFDIKSAATVLVHVNSGATPSGGDPSFEILSHPGDWDFVMSGLTASDYIWARSKESASVDLVVGRV